MRAPRQLDHGHQRCPPSNPDLIGTDWTSAKVAQLRYEPASHLWSLYK
jgi:hypothetical protein